MAALVHQVKIRQDRKLAPAQMSELYAAVGFPNVPDDEHLLQQRIKHTDVLLTAYLDEKLIGLVRALTDYQTTAILTEVVVHPNFQRQGIGRKLVQSLLMDYHLASVETIAVIGGPREFFGKLGFREDPGALMSRSAAW